MTLLDSNAEYMRLRDENEAGWGGKVHSQRQDGWSRMIARLRQYPNFPSSPARVLELGCGNGMISELLAHEGYDVTGIELSQEAVSWATERFANAGLSGTFLQGSVTDMQMLEQQVFDVVIDGNCLHCLIGADRKRCLSEVRRVLRHNGVFVISSMCGSPKSSDALSRFDKQSRCLTDNGKPYRTLIPADEILAELHDTGFRVVWSEISINPWWDHLTAFAVT